MMKIHMAQVNPTIGAFASNVQQVSEEIGRGAANGARFVVFPELTLTGYYPKDLLLEEDFMVAADRAFEHVREISAAYPDIYIVLGHPIRNDGRGKRFLNGLRVLKAGQIALQYAKRLLPNYGVYDEYRHFEPGNSSANTLDVDGCRVAFLICEDIWDIEHLDYIADPIGDVAASKPDVLITINASPSHVGKRLVRHQLGARIVKRLVAWLVYVNQVGGQDELVFDGGSFVMSSGGTIVEECVRFKPDGRTVTVEPHNLALFRPDVRLDQELTPAAFYIEQSVLGLRDYMRRCNFSKVVVGSSGGIDSAVTLALAARAIGSENVVGITMPSRYSSVGSVTDSEELCNNLGIRLHEHSIKDLVETARAGFTAAFSDSYGFGGRPAEIKGVAQENIQARLRANILMSFSNSYGHLLLTTGNKSELATGFATYLGDMAGGLNLIGDLYKMEVYDVAREINRQAGRALIPEAIIDKAPSAELAPDQVDADSLPPYPVLDRILRGLIEFDPDGVEYCRTIESGSDEALKNHLRTTRRRLALSEYKRRQAPPIIRVRPRAFGTGRQMPIAADYNYSGYL